MSSRSERVVELWNVGMSALFAYCIARDCSIYCIALAQGRARK